MLKKLISFAAAAVIASCCITASAAGTAKGSGDVNGDGVVNAADVIKVASQVKGFSTLSSSEKKRADVNGDGKVDSLDINILACSVKGVSEKDEVSDAEQYAEEMVRLINKERTSRGLSKLAYSPELCKAADIRVNEITTRYDHVRPNGSQWYTVFEKVGISYTGVAENIAYGYSTPASAMNGFMNSAMHRENILNGSYKYVGIGVIEVNGTYYWVQHFASGSGMSGSVIG